MAFEHEYEDTVIDPLGQGPDPLGEVLARRSREGWELVTAYWMPTRYGHGGTHRTYWKRESDGDPAIG
jgi:hypothetical protein